MKLKINAMGVMLIVLLTIFWIVSSRMTITTPNNLVDKIGNNGIVEHKIANMGIIPYGHFLIGNIVCIDCLNIYSFSALITNMVVKSTTRTKVDHMKTYIICSF